MGTHVPRLPPGRYPRDRWWNLATAPLVMMLATFGLITAALLAIAGYLIHLGYTPRGVKLWFDNLQHGLWAPVVATGATLFLTALNLVLRKMVRDGGIDRGVDRSNKLMEQLLARQDADREEARRRDAAQAALIDAQADLIEAQGERLDVAVAQMLGVLQEAVAAGPGPSAVEPAWAAPGPPPPDVEIARAVHPFDTSRPWVRDHTGTLAPVLEVDVDADVDAAGQRIPWRDKPSTDLIARVTGRRPEPRPEARRDPLDDEVWADHSTDQ